MVSIEKSAKTVKEAIRLGLEELKCDSADVDIEVLEMGSPGIFGMFGKPVKVRLTRKDAGDEFDIEMPRITLDANSPRKERAPKPSRKKEAKADAETAPEAKNAEQRPERKSKSRPKKEAKPARERAVAAQEASSQEETAPAPVKTAETIIEDEPFIPTAEDALTPSAIQARDFVKELSTMMGAQIEMQIQETPEQLRIKMAGENMNLLIGRRGETLDSIQYLTSLCVNRNRDEYLRISLDTENYRAKREEALRKLAVRMANRARKTGKRVSLEPMNPYERRILHSALQNDPDVSTHSEGEEPYRRVIITLK